MVPTEVNCEKRAPKDTDEHSAIYENHFKTKFSLLHMLPKRQE